MEIKLDDTNLLAGMVGETHGLTQAEINGARPKAFEARAAFRRAFVEGKYGFPDLPFQRRVADEIASYAKAKRGCFETVCVVGIGGSALGAWALDCGLRGPHPVQGAYSETHPRLVILDNVDPSFVQAALDSMDPAKTLVVVIAKSGETPETVATFLIVRRWLKSKDRTVAVTSPDRGDLKELADREGYRQFYIPANVGGRFSVLSPVGLLPAALLGVDIRKLVEGAAAMTDACWKQDLEQNPALRAALLHYLIWTRKNKTIQVVFPYSNRLWGTAFWFRQLWAESLGKAVNRKGELVHVGQTPVAALGTTDQHSQVQLYMEGPNDKVFTFWTLDSYGHEGRIPEERLSLASFDFFAGRSLAELIDAERRATTAALTSQQRPNCTVTLGRADEEHLGAFLQMMEFQTAFMGELLDIDAFNQPGVQLGKDYTYALMGREGYEKYREEYGEYENKHEAARKGGL